jgi:predicted methyltransferase
MIRKRMPILALGLALVLGAPALAQDAPAYVAAAVAAPDRPKADTDRDALRKPAALIAFAGLKPSQSVADLMPGGGYFTRLFSHVVGAGGKVYAVVPSELGHLVPDMVTNIKGLAANPAYANVTVVEAPTDALAAPQLVDMAWTSDNYHDVYGFFGPDKAAAFDLAVFKMLKPGGVFIVIDHAANPGAPDASVKALHRIDPAVVKAQVLAAGFTLEAQSPILANPADPHDVSVFSPSIRGHTDQFVLKFRKPG